MVSVLAWPGVDSNAVYTLTESARDRAVFSIDTAGGLRVVKEFALGNDYALTCRVRIENNSKQAIETPAFGVAVGTAGQLDEQDDATYVNADYWGKDVTTTGRANVTYTPASSMAERGCVHHVCSPMGGGEEPLLHVGADAEGPGCRIPRAEGGVAAPAHALGQDGASGRARVVVDGKCEGGRGRFGHAVSSSSTQDRRNTNASSRSATSRRK